MPPLIIDCPSCSRKLRVPDELIGKAVKCPTCEHTFAATTAQASTTLPPVPPPAPAVADSSAAVGDEPSVSFKAEGQRSQGLDDNLWLCPSCGERIEKDAARCRFCGEEIKDGEEEDDRPWEESRRFRGRRDAEPHRGTLILALGIISIVMVVLCGPVGLPLGIAAWVMGRRDLIKMRQNLMDREGEGLTQAGWICGIIGTLLDSLSLLCVLLYIGFIFTFIASVRRGPPQAPAPVPIRPAPLPIRPVPAPAPGQPGNKAALHYLPQRLQDYLPTTEG